MRNCSKQNNTHTHTHIYIYIYTYIYMRERGWKTDSGETERGGKKGEWKNTARQWQG